MLVSVAHVVPEVKLIFMVCAAPKVSVNVYIVIRDHPEDSDISPCQGPYGCLWSFLWPEFMYTLLSMLPLTIMGKEATIAVITMTSNS